MHCFLIVRSCSFILPTMARMDLLGCLLTMLRTFSAMATALQLRTSSAIAAALQLGTSSAMAAGRFAIVDFLGDGRRFVGVLGDSCRFAMADVFGDGCRFAVADVLGDGRSFAIADVLCDGRRFAVADVLGNGRRSAVADVLGDGHRPLQSLLLFCFFLSMLKLRNSSNLFFTK
jgi:hypothetical protein